MDLDLKPALREQPQLRAAAREIEKCVHCGFCLPACPTYELEHNELDSPRGRIFLVKRLLEGKGDPELVTRHLDRCLSCRSCETACPSDVGFATIAHQGRALAGAQRRRAPLGALWRWLLGEVFRSRRLGALGARLLRLAAPVLPARLGRLLPRVRIRRHRGDGARGGVAIFTGCAQQGLMPHSNQALAAILSRLGYRVRMLEGVCCGALRQHSGRESAAARDMRRSLDACAAALEGGDHAILLAGSGCASFLDEYPGLLGADPYRRALAERVRDRLQDPAAFLRPHAEQLRGFIQPRAQQRIALHRPCTLTNGLRSPAAYPELLRALGYATVEPVNPPNCCGSAGLHALLRPQAAGRLRTRMGNSFMTTAATAVATANIGCALHMRGGCDLPVDHWLDLLAADWLD